MLIKFVFFCSRLMYNSNGCFIFVSHVYISYLQLVQLQTQNEYDIESPANMRAELGDKIKEVNNLRNEFERVKKDKNITSGLVTQMQRDMSNKVRQLCRENCTQ